MSEYINRPAKKARRKAQPSSARSRMPRQRTETAMGQGLRVAPATRGRLIAEAVEICEVAIASGAVAAVEKRAAHYAGEEVWTQLAHRKIGRNCRWLARLARMALDGKDWLHARVGDIFFYILVKLKAPEIVRVFGARAAEKIPLPFDEQLIAVARGMQVTGIVICIMNGRDLTKCESFLDLINTEGKERLKQLIQQAAGDWTNLQVSARSMEAA
ncbi:hypothetical protein AB0B85_14180 [Micromonospora sp. NPDC049044]|uniref:hypothetical protein n=1 Tax=Micromonospora sp. NPDC049044 TaxID=3154827 RepID=UPI0033D07876